MRHQTLYSVLSAFVLMSLLFVACGGTGGEAATATAQPTAEPMEQATQAPEPTDTLAPTATPEPEARILRIRITADIQNLDPVFRISQIDQEVSAAVFSGLVQYAPNSYELVNDLVESIEQSEDGLEITFKLKEGIQWQKGYGELTAEDVKFSFERFIDPELSSPYAGDWAALDHVEVIDKYQGKIVLTEPSAPLWHTTLPVGSGLIVSKKYVEEVGADRFATDIIGTGPYIFEEWQPKEEIVLKRNPEYYGAAPYWDEIHLMPVEEDKSAEIALEAGDLDYSPISLSSFDRFEKAGQLSVKKLPSLSYSWIGMNVENPKLQDINVREAIRYAIDVPSIIQVAYMGQVEQATGLIAPGLLGYWADAPRYERDLEKAKEYMAKAGLEKLDLRLDLQDTSEYRAWAEVAEQNLKDIGINLTLNPMDSASYWSIGEGDQGKEVELFTMSFAMEPDPSWATMWFTCDQVGVWNWMRWCSPEFDELHNKGLVALDSAQREEIYIEMQKLWDAAAHTVWITHGASAFAYKSDIKPSWTPNGLNQYEFFGPAD